MESAVDLAIDSSKLTGILKKGENEISFRLDNSIVKFNGKYIQAPAPMKIIGNRLMIPAQFVANKFGAESYMNTKKNHTTYISTHRWQNYISGSARVIHCGLFLNFLQHQ